MFGCITYILHWCIFFQLLLQLIIWFDLLFMCILTIWNVEYSKSTAQQHQNGCVKTIKKKIKKKQKLFHYDPNQIFNKAIFHKVLIVILVFIKSRKIRHFKFARICPQCHHIQHNIENWNCDLNANPFSKTSKYCESETQSRVYRLIHVWTYSITMLDSWAPCITWKINAHLGILYPMI